MGLRGTLIASLAGVLGALALVLATTQWGAGVNDDGRQRFRYLLEDVSDRAEYQYYGAWLPTGLTPYLQIKSEYPQLATWLLGVPYLFFDSQLKPGALPKSKEIIADHEAYARVHQSLMAVAFAALLLATALCLRDLRRSPAWALLCFLPGPLYFTFSRFDAWLAMLVMVALLLQLRGRRTAAATMLALGAMMKWYPALLVPLFLAWNYRTAGAAAPGAPTQGGFSRLRGAVLWPCAAAGLVCVATLAVNFAWDGGGMPAVLYHYRWQMDRPLNASSLAWALTAPGRWEWFSPEAQPVLVGVLTALQLLPALLLPFVPLRSSESLLLGCLTIVMSFTLFTKVFSPQWIVWITPLAILVVAGSRTGLVLLLLLAVMIYVEMPLLYYEIDWRARSTTEDADAYWTATNVRIVLMSLLLAWSAVSFVRSVRRERRLALRGPEPSVGPENALP